jgi:hypothetical protein
VFHKSWSGEKRLLKAAILIFVPGILKCFEKPFALKNASIHSIAASTFNTNRTTWVSRLFQEDSTEGNVEEMNSLDAYVKSASTYVQRQQYASEMSVSNKPYNLFVDMAFSYSDRLKNLEYIMQRKNKAHLRLRTRLSNTFDRLYTKHEVTSGINICDITELVFDHVVVHGWTENIKDAATFHEFNNNRGQLTIQREGCTGGMPLESLRRPFDESLILWHLATDFCFFDVDAAGKSV